MADGPDSWVSSQSSSGEFSGFVTNGHLPDSPSGVTLQLKILLFMHNLEPPDSHHLSAAVGWLELGNPAEAKAELDGIHAKYRTHPLVVRVRCEMDSRAKNWESVLAVAEAMITETPDDPYGWISRSNALHFLKRYQEAYDRLLPAIDTFPGNAEMRYNVACFCCRMNRIDEARQWLKKAFTLEPGSKLRAAALADPDLEPLWAEISAGNA